MSISGIESIGGFTPLAAPSVSAPARTAGPQGPAFGTLLTDSIQSLEGLHDRADALSVQAATGDLNAIHDYTLAATESSVATQLTVAVRNKAVEAFNEIMRMQV